MLPIKYRTGIYSVLAFRIQLCAVRFNVAFSINEISGRKWSLFAANFMFEKEIFGQNVYLRFVSVMNEVCEKCAITAHRLSFNIIFFQGLLLRIF